MLNSVDHPKIPKQSMAKALIFGSNGQDGFYLSELLKKEGLEVVTSSRSNADMLGDISNFNFVEAIVKLSQPDYIFHLAAKSSNQHHAILDNQNSISGGTINVLEAAYRHAKHCKVFLAGSGLQFENRNLPINEATPFAADSPYAISRIHSIYAGRYFRRKKGLKVYIGYLFNHDSALRRNSHVNMYIIEQVCKIAKQGHGTLEVGDYSVQKEFGNAEEIVAGMWTLMQQDTVFEACIGTGVAHPISKWIDLCFAHFDLDWQKHTVQLPNFTADYRILVSDPSLINSLGWKATSSIEEMASLMIEGFLSEQS
jgi:GDPmannose 4,6-dehydratase